MEQTDILLTILFFIIFLICESKSESYNTIINNRPVTLLYPDSQTAIVSMYTIDTKKISKYTIDNLKMYCNIYKYGLYIYFKSPQKTSKDVSTDKFKTILDILTNKNQHKYIVWLDFNCFIVNKLKIFLDYISLHQNVDFIMCKNKQSNMFLTNMIIIKNTDWSRKIIKSALHYSDNNAIQSNTDSYILYKIIKKDGIITNKINKVNGIHENIYLYNYDDFFSKNMFLTIDNSIPSIININKKLDVY